MAAFLQRSGSVRQFRIGRGVTASPSTNLDEQPGRRMIHVLADGERAFVTYELACTGRGASRNTEILRLRDGKIGEVEVYFRWPIPHETPEGGFVEPKAAH